jgi:hypothetical protein
MPETPVLRDAEAEGLQNCGYPGLCSKFEVSLGYIERPCLKKKKKRTVPPPGILLDGYRRL